MTPDQVNKTAVYVAGYIRDLKRLREAGRNEEAEEMQTFLNVIGGAIQRACGYEWYAVVANVASEISRREHDVL